MTFRFSRISGVIAALTMAVSVPAAAQTLLVKSEKASAITQAQLSTANNPDEALVAAFYGSSAEKAHTTSFKSIDAAANIYAFDFLSQGVSPLDAQSAGNDDASATEALHDNIIMSAVPEPEVWAMFIFGMVAVGFGLRRRRRLNDEVGYTKLV